MAKVSPSIKGFNAGEFSPLVEARTDLDRAPFSSRKLRNIAVTPQGPAVPRSGTEFINEVANNNKKSTLIPFIFDEETDKLMLEFGDFRIRFFTEEGAIFTMGEQSMTVLTRSPAFTFSSALLNASVGDQVVFSDFPGAYNLNGIVANVTAKVGTTYTVDASHPNLPFLSTAKVSRVYHVASPYTSEQGGDIFPLQSLDVVMLWHPDIRPYKLSRRDTYDWAVEPIEFTDGPYLALNDTTTKLTLSSTGKATPNMTGNSTPSGVASASALGDSTQPYMAFDDPALNTYVRFGVNQTGWIKYEFPSAVTIDGYSIRRSSKNQDLSYTAKDFAPGAWTFEGSNDDTNWTVLDRQINYVLYDGGKSGFFEIPNTTAYKYYRLNVTELTRNGAEGICIGGLIMRSVAASDITVTASAVTGINNGKGFSTTDVGRHLRIKGSDTFWRWMIITKYNSPTSVDAKLMSEPFPDLIPSANWRLGAWSATTGWPNTVVFDNDRLWAAGSTATPDFFAFSQTGLYFNFAPTAPDGSVLDTNGYGARLNTRRMSRIKWMAVANERFLMGSGSASIALKTADGSGKAIGPNNIRALITAARGSASIPALTIDSQVIAVHRTKRSLREFAYSYELDGFKTPSMSQLSSHIGAKKFVQLAYAEEPYSIVWARRDNGTLVGMTYNRDENVIGWHQHTFPEGTEQEGDAFGVIESIATMPSQDLMQDTLWMTIKRTINGQTKRYIEKLTRFWDFDMTIDDAHFVDCGLRYSGDPISVVYGLSHLEGCYVYGVADRRPFGPVRVVEGRVTLDDEASNIVIGIGFSSEGFTARMDSGAADGSSMGRTARTNQAQLLVWESAGGEIGVYNPVTQDFEYTPLDGDYPYVGDGNIDEGVELYSGFLNPTIMPDTYEDSRSIAYRRPAYSPLPFNIVAIRPVFEIPPA